MPLCNYTSLQVCPFANSVSPFANTVCPFANAVCPLGNIPLCRNPTNSLLNEMGIKLIRDFFHAGGVRGGGRRKGRRKGGIDSIPNPQGKPMNKNAACTIGSRGESLEFRFTIRLRMI